MARWLFLVLLLLAIGVPLAVYQDWLQVPPRWNPWAPLDVRDERNLLTGFKLMRLQQDPALCRQALASSSLKVVALPDSTPAAGCPLDNSLRVSGSEVAFSSSFIATCKLAVAYALFGRHGLPASRALHHARTVLGFAVPSVAQGGDQRLALLRRQLFPGGQGRRRRRLGQCLGGREQQA